MAESENIKTLSPLELASMLSVVNTQMQQTVKACLDALAKFDQLGPVGKSNAKAASQILQELLANGVNWGARLSEAVATLGGVTNGQEA